MRFEFNKKDWDTIVEGEKNCYLLTNGLGGYSSLSVIGAAARGDHALLMSAKRAPNVREHLVTNIFEKLTIGSKTYVLTSQRMKSGQDYTGYQYLEKFVYDDFDETAPAWTFSVDGVTVVKRIVMAHEENTVALKYEINNSLNKEVTLELMPLLRLTSKKELFDSSKKLPEYSEMQSLKVITNAELYTRRPELFGEMYFSQDERDGREAYGDAFINHVIKAAVSDKEDDIYVVFSTQTYAEAETSYTGLVQTQKERREQIVRRSGLVSELGKQLVLSADAYVVRRDSTNGKSIIAGYPFFEDWGRDTMISLAGATMITGRYEECKSILRTFAKYVKNGLLPNLFPEGSENPMYNSADAPLLFVNSVYEYMEYAQDYEFKDEILPVLEQIIEKYKNGTDFHIKMDTDGLIMAGAGLEQLTWMDVRVGDFLPTPRHGKPVEINAYWYSALVIMYKLTGKTAYQELAQQVSKAFNEKFWNEEEHCLKDVLSGKNDENQIRCNQIWALTMPFTMLPAEKEALVIKKVRDELYTTVGLRSLSKKDADFHEIYIGRMEERDRAYHQGTVWAFPLGAYYRACIRHYAKCTDMAEKEKIKEELRTGFDALKSWLEEGCISQIAEIYDGGTPTVSRGCFAQAWSVAELLRAVSDFEKNECTM